MNEEVQGKGKAKKVSYTKLMESKDRKDKRTHKERYRKEVKLAITTTKMTAFECL